MKNKIDSKDAEVLAVLLSVSHYLLKGKEDGELLFDSETIKLIESLLVGVLIFTTACLFKYKLVSKKDYIKVTHKRIAGNFDIDLLDNMFDSRHQILSQMEELKLDAMEILIKQGKL